MRKRNSVITIFAFCFAVALTSTIWGIRHGGSALPPDSVDGANTAGQSASTPSAAAVDEKTAEHSQPQNLGSQPRAATLPDPPPVYDWVKDRTESFVLDPGQVIAYPVQPDEVANATGFGPHLIRFDLKATSPVDAGALSDEFSQKPSYFFGSAVTLCYGKNELQSQHTCRLTGSQTHGLIIVSDLRGTDAKDVILAGAAAIMGAKEPMNKALRENRVTLTFYQWKCQQFCL